MPAYKNQHFLAQRALRRFGHADERSIDLFNLRTRLVVRGASIANQCSKPYFYMKSGVLEVPFAEIENKGLDVFQTIEVTGIFPAKGTAAHHDLIRYISFQEGRTLGAVQEVQDSQEEIAKKFLEEYLKVKGDPDHLLDHLAKLKITFHNLPLENVFRATVASPLLSDLSLGVFEASPNQEFVLADDPIVLTNAFRSVDGVPSCGLASRGLIILCPIAPTRTLTLYDGEVYRVRTHPLSKAESIELNVTQAASSYANFYFRNYDLVAESCSAPRSFPRVADLQVQRMTDRRGVLLSHIRPAVALGPLMSRRFIVRSAAKRNNFKVGDLAVRDPELANIVRNLREPKDLAAFMRGGGHR